MSSGQVIVESKLEDTHIGVRNGTVSVETVNTSGDVQDKSDYYSCRMGDGDGGQLSHFHMKIQRKTHIFYCSVLEVGGFESVYVLSFPDLESLAHKNGVVALVLLVCMLATIVISIGVFIIIILKSAKREMFLCDALIKQMESTQQAERKSMNKSLAFANASHDIRSSLAAISGLIDLCHETAKPHSDLSANLTQINTCVVDLVGILNSVLDTSKIEAGKMQLQEEEFNIAELLEDVVNMYYLLGMKKGVDMVFDPCDGSIFKFNLVRGDRAKLKQILCNLLNNATKFTSEGHISVRAIAKKLSIENAIIASNRKSVLNCLSNLCFKNKGSFNTLEGLHTIQRDSNCMEYIFDVDDTGKGIPKDKQESVFENFVQVEETTIREEGTGLGLGIVQSLRNKELLRTQMHMDIQLMSIIVLGVVATYTRWIACHSLSCWRRAQKSVQKVDSELWCQSLGCENNQDLLYVLELIKKKRDLSLPSSETIVVDTLQKPSNNSNRSRPLSSSSKRSSGLILIVIDAKATSVSELRPVLANFRKELYHVLGLLPEFGGSIQLNIPEDKTIMTREVHHSSQGIRYSDQVITVPIQKNEVEQVVIHETNKESINEQLPLNGKNVLVVDDHKIQLKLSATVLRKLGASPHVCENGKDAYDLVCKTLKDKNEGVLCFDYIFMDCEMPVMDGFEATRLIREEEKVHGIHTPIIALTAYETPEEIGWTIEAGMDHHLVKPLQVTKVLELLQR
ncbi:UNVERIFIED_CONTAM: Histidine kinase CKI1 [Sesamum angustifolium]|uniref:histidine kinase n=1 Tax=Sesamum angustifolium TaxID=2727405 RepID=A0AAW2QAM9_9LAMI